MDITLRYNSCIFIIIINFSVFLIDKTNNFKIDNVVLFKYGLLNYFGNIDNNNNNRKNNNFNKNDDNI